MKIWLDWSTAFDDTTWPAFGESFTRIFKNAWPPCFAKSFVMVRKPEQVSPDINPEIAAYMVIAGGHMMVQMRLAEKPPVDINAFLNKLVAGALKPHGTLPDEGCA